MLKKWYRAFLNELMKIKSYLISNFLASNLDYGEYIDLQHRCDPLEFVDERTKILSSFVYLFTRLGEIGLLKKNVDIDSSGNEKVVGYNNSFLDVGTRDGYVVEFVNSFGFKTAKGIELLPDYVEYARSKGRNVELGDIHDLPFKTSTFDIVYCRHTIEHTLFPQKALKELYRVVNNNGALYVSFPLEMKPDGKHTAAIPNVKVLKNMISTLKPTPCVVYIGLSSKVGIIPQGNEVCVLTVKQDVYNSSKG
jgi:SAM-dependent methyltransferase|tara:strand:- start:421 stop:1173 length:753 start_codon:yes stop_codon:yes gene_type:complete